MPRSWCYITLHPVPGIDCPFADILPHPHPLSLLLVEGNSVKTKRQTGSLWLKLYTESPFPSSLYPLPHTSVKGPVLKDHLPPVRRPLGLCAGC